MTASEVIAEIDRLPPEEREVVFLHVRTLEEESIPDSFLQSLAEAQRGELTVMEDGQFLRPPAV